jgi:hypothetical protein
MILLTEELRERLLANGRERNADHIPVAKFFYPLGQGVRLATELDADGDAVFGLADLVYPELGSFSLLEMTSVRLPFGMGIERDILFATDLPIRPGHKPPARPEAFATPNASSTMSPNLAGTARLSLKSVEEEMRKVMSAALRPLQIFRVRRSPQRERAAPFFVTGLEVERVSATRHGDNSHGYAQAEDHPQRLARHPLQQTDAEPVQCPAHQARGND